MKRVPRIEEDTPIIPGLVAWCVWHDTQVWLGEPLPRGWVRELTAQANTVYAHNERFRRRIRGRGNTGRDSLWMFMRHWLAAIMKHRRPHLHARMPASYNQGQALPPPAARDSNVPRPCAKRRLSNRAASSQRKANPRRRLWADELHARLFPLI